MVAHLRMKLNAPLRPMPMAHGHDAAILLRNSKHLEAVRQAVSRDDQRVVAHRPETVRHALKQRRPRRIGVRDRQHLDAAQSAMHDARRGDHRTAVHDGQALVTEANTECRQRALAQQRRADGKVLRAPATSSGAVVAVAHMVANVIGIA